MMSLFRRAARRAQRVPRGLVLRAARAGIRALSGPGAERPPIIEDLHLVLSPNRVGSNTLWNVLRQLPVEGAFHKAHSLCGPELPGWEECPFPKWELVQMNESDGKSWERVVLHRRLIARAAVAGGTPPRKIRVMSAVREPVAQWISALFYSAQRYPEALDPASLTVEKVTRYLTGELHIVYPWLEPGEWWEHDGWIHRELGERMGFSVFRTPFDRERGWQLYEGADARLLIIRQESMGRIREAVGEFYGLEPATVPTVRENDSGSFPYHEQYLGVRGQIRLPGPLLDRIYSTELVRHFYTPGEIAGFKERWSGRSA
jgi:hypothetical protein